MVSKCTAAGLILPALIACLIGSAGAEATFSFLYSDAAGFGFNDLTVQAPVGGNPGTTLGQQRRNVLEAVADVWAGHLQSDVPIVVRARFEVLGGSSTAATIAYASREDYERDFPGAPLSGTWYAGALANSLAGSDLNPLFPDILAGVNESIDSDPGVLGGVGFYYGFDHLAGGRIDLFNVLLHELGHGLGFGSTANLAFGIFPGGFPDSYSIHLRDIEVDKAWPEMTNAERAASARNGPDVVWTGEFTTAAAREVLGTGQVEILAPTAASAVIGSGRAFFGPPLTLEGVEGAVVLVDDGVAPVTDACEEPFANAAGIAGNIALIDRGTCLFIEKVRRAQQAGARGVIVADNVSGAVINMSGDANDIEIPSVLVSLADGNLLKALLPGLLVRLDAAGEALGTADGRVRIYAPDPLESGSSISHWNRGHTIGLLMEPSDAPGVRDDLDLTLTAMKDIGWGVVGIPFPHLTYELWADERFGPGAADAGRTDDPDGDGRTNFEEYAFGGDPRLAADGAVIESVSPARDGTAMEFIKDPRAVDVGLTVESGLDLQTWQRVVPVIEQDRVVLEENRARLTIGVPASGHRRFFRLKAEAR